MDHFETIRLLNQKLLTEMPEYQAQARTFPQEEAAQRRLLRSLMNIRPPMPLSPDFLDLQDALLPGEREARGVVDAEALPEVPGHPGIVLWRGDITRLKTDAIVNAANSALLGCFVPCHGCIDNAIHSAAGLQLREACRRLMETQDHEEPTGQAKITKGYNLPASYVLHTVGPIVRGKVAARDRVELAACYRACLALAAKHELESVAFCCISTGEFHFPNREAAEIAIETVTDFLKTPTSVRKVIFNVFKDTDEQIYRELLGTT